jgi:hypothetical protein
MKVLAACARIKWKHETESISKDSHEKYETQSMENETPSRINKSTFDL